MATSTKKLKKKLLRNNEYYGTQELFDDLYAMSQKGCCFNDLMPLITSRQNILLAYRSIKRNKGSKTKGTNPHTIFDVGNTETDKLVKYVEGRLRDYQPHMVRRKEIEKPNGGIRPLGIPTIEDRLIQQCIKQVMEPICEAKFHPDSYGFRPNRSAHHAIARTEYLIQHAGLHYVIDVDIKGFFDNVNHGKLLKQTWAMGIQDKNLLCVLSKLLKAEIKGIGRPDKGTPQGGIISPLLSNIVLNELDWWVSDQWQTFETTVKDYGQNRYRALKKTNLKEVWIVRYADDFKILCRTRDCANRMFGAVQQWLKERLSLDISLEKSKIVNLRKQYSEFLGFKIKAVEKAGKHVTIAHITNKAKKRVIKQILEKADALVEKPTTTMANRFNSTILGMHNYYKIASCVALDFANIDFLVRRGLHNRLHFVTRKTGDKSKVYQKYYGGYNPKPMYVANVALFPIYGVKFSIPRKFTQTICNFTPKGRSLIHDALSSTNPNILRYIMENPSRSQSTEFNDNRISLYVGQNGKCAITGKALEIGNMEVHHKIPRTAGGTDAYANLVWLSVFVHQLIHATRPETIQRLVGAIKPNDVMVSKINEFRVKVGNCEI